ncbi:MAG: mevalonate kinase [Acidimicrobiales bacterium]
MIRRSAPARVGLLGNPSDGYGGRTLALAVPRFEATVTLDHDDGIVIVGHPDDEPRWPSLEAMTERLDRHGYGTGPQLLAATVRTFVDVARSIDHPLVPIGFRLSYETSIPRQVGLGGSSALVVAALRCLGEHHGLTIPEILLPSIALRVETEELGLSAGLQDRVVQTFGGLVAMDFAAVEVDARFGVAHGHYEQIDCRTLPPLFLAYREGAAEPSDVYHHRLRVRYEEGDPVVREVLRDLAALVVEGRAALRWDDGARFAQLLGRNMALRLALGPLPADQLELIEVAAACGAEATFAGSGGSVVGVHEGPTHLAALGEAYATVGAEVVAVEPSGTVVDDDGDDDPADNVVALPRRADR